MKQESLFINNSGRVKKSKESREMTQNLFSESGSYIDSHTGEIGIRKGHLLKKIKSPKQDDFVKLFAESVYFISNLTGSEIKVFWSLLMMMNYKNIVILSSDLRKRISMMLGVTHSSVTQNLQSLIKKNVILHLNPEKMSEEAMSEFNIFACDKKAYLINPDIVGKGSFRDLTRIRQVVVKEYDFENLEYIETLNNQFEYNGLNEVLNDLETHKIENVKIEQNDNVRELEVLIAKKEQKAEQQQITLKNSNDDVASIESAINAFNQELEAEQARKVKLEEKYKEILEQLKEKLIAKEGNIEEFLKISDKLRSNFINL